MPYDIAGARRAGYSDEEIQAYLASRPRQQQRPSMPPAALAEMRRLESLQQGIEPTLPPVLPNASLGQTLADLVSIPASYLMGELGIDDPLLIAGLRYKRPNVSAAARLAAEQYHRRPLTDPMKPKHTVFHATDPTKLEDILKAGAIVPEPSLLREPGVASWEDVRKLGLESYPKEIRGVSVSRIPRASSKGHRAVSFVIDAEAMPPSRPFTEPSYRKTLGNAPWEVDEYHKPRMNPLFEFENRTYDQPIPLSAVREIWVDRSAVPGGLTPELKGHLQNTRDLAERYNIPLREFRSGREMHRGRATLSDLMRKKK